jgi:hypothetical protein
MNFSKNNKQENQVEPVDKTAENWEFQSKAMMSWAASMGSRIDNLICINDKNAFQVVIHRDFK